MKNRQKKSKYIVSEDSATEQALSAAAGAGEGADIRITTHGKIRNYADYINNSLQTQPERALFIYAQGAAVSKLVTVLEIVKRTGHTGLTQLLTIGDSTSSPCARRIKAPSAEYAETAARGMYSSTLAKAFSQALPSDVTASEGPKPEPLTEAKQPGEPWMQAELHRVL